MDAVLQVTDPQGNVLAQSDDERGIDPQLIFTAPNADEYLIRIFAFPQTPNSTIGFAGGKSYVYVLRLATVAVTDHGLPLAADNSLSNAMCFGTSGPREARILPSTEVSPPILLDDAPGWQWLTPLTAAEPFSYGTDASIDKMHGTPPTVLSGHISKDREVDRFVIELDEAKKYTIQARSREFGFVLDPTVRILSIDSGEQLAEGKDIARTNYDSSVDFKPKESGQYALEISDAVDSFGLRHAYSITVREAAAEVKLGLVVEQLSIAQGSESEVAVTVSRRNGFDKVLQIAVEGLPAGLQSPPLESANKGDSSKAVKLKIQAAGDCQPFQGWIQIVGRDTSDKNQAYLATYPLRPSVPLARVWLTVAPK
ncbi:MAG: hypothetical protein AAF483_29095, partial [Planctomycetota bacterium]